MGNEASTANNGAGVSTTCSNANSCKTCKGLGNRETDTVKIDLDALASRGKENAGDHQQIKETAAQKQQRVEAEKLRAAEEERAREEERRIRQAEEAKRRAEEERRAREQEQERLRALQEAKRRAEEEQKRLRALEEQRLEEERRAAEELRRAQEEERRLRAEEQRLREQQAAREQQEAQRRRKEQEEKAQKLAKFLKDHGFQGVNEKQKKKGLITSGFVYPLHAAVEANDPGAVELLLQHGADPSIQSSKKQTPLKLAETKNKAGSHKRVIALLSQKA